MVGTVIINDFGNSNDLGLKKRNIFLTALSSNRFRKIIECQILRVLTGRLNFLKTKQKTSDPQVTNSENSPLLSPFCRHCPVFLHAMKSTRVPVYLACIFFILGGRHRVVNSQSSLMPGTEHLKVITAI